MTDALTIMKWILALAEDRQLSPFNALHEMLGRE